MRTPESEDLDFGALGKIDRVIHEPARLEITAWLSVLEEADFLFLLQQTGQSRGNLSSHISRLEDSGYVDVTKAFIGKTPRTVYRLTSSGKIAFRNYKRTILSVLGNL